MQKIYDYGGRTVLTDLEKDLIRTLAEAYIVADEAEFTIYEALVGDGRYRQDSIISSAQGKIYDLMISMVNMEPDEEYQCRKWYDVDKWHNKIWFALEGNGKRVKPNPEKLIIIIEQFMRCKARDVK